MIMSHRDLVTPRRVRMHSLLARNDLNGRFAKAERHLEDGSLSKQAPSSMLLQGNGPPAPEGLCEKQTNAETAETCQQVLEEGHCEGRIEECAATCCAAGVWIQLWP